MRTTATHPPLSRLLPPTLLCLCLGVGCSGSKTSVEQPAPTTPAPAPVAPVTPVLTRPGPTAPNAAVVPAAAGTVVPAAAPAPTAVGDTAATPSAPAPVPVLAANGENTAVRSAATPVKEPEPPRAPGTRLLVGRIQASEQLVDEAAQAREEIVRQLAKRPETTVFSDDEMSRGRELARHANPKCEGEACLPTVALLLNADALITGSLAREHHEYVLTISLARARSPHPTTTSESMHHLRNLSLNVGLCLDRLLAASP